ncbi:myb-like protein X [Hydra vulgaris]|uniref:Myb-like protein X n=1 Tax=Hydra vulgaris TaxID=6087 RepID=A0ABM4D499_HYDVU
MLIILKNMINCISFKTFLFVIHIFQIVITKNNILKLNDSKLKHFTHFNVVTKRSELDKKCLTNVGIGAIAPDFQICSKRYYGMSPGFSVAGGLSFLGSGRDHQNSGHRECNHSNECESHDDHGYGYPDKTHGNYAGGGVSFSEHSEPNCMMMHNSQNGHMFHGGALHMDAGGHLSRAHHGIHGHGIGGGGGHGGHPDHECHERHECHGRDHSCEGFGGGHHQLMQVPLSPLPQGFHEGFGPSECENHECENHDDDDCEQEERDREYDLDRGGCEEGHWLRQEKHKASDMENDHPQKISQTASHSSNIKEHEEIKDIDGSIVSGIIKPSKGTETGTDVENEGFFPTKLCNNKIVSGETGIVSAGLKGRKKKYGELQWDQDINGKDETELHRAEQYVGYENHDCNQEQKKTFQSKSLLKEEEKKKPSEILHLSNQIGINNVTKSKSKNTENASGATTDDQLGDNIKLDKDKVRKQKAGNFSLPYITQLDKNNLSVNKQIKSLHDSFSNVKERHLTLGQELLTMPVSFVSPQRSVLPINSSFIENGKNINSQYASDLRASPGKLLSYRNSNNTSDKDKFEYSSEYSTKSLNFESKSEFNYNQSSFNFTVKYNSKHPGYRYEYKFGIPTSSINTTDENKQLKVGNKIKDEKAKEVKEEKDSITSVLNNDVENRTQSSEDKHKKIYQNKQYVFQSVNHTSNKPSNNLSVTAPLLESILPLKTFRPDSAHKINDIKESTLVEKTSRKERKNKLLNTILPKQTESYSISVKQTENNQKVPKLKTEDNSKIIAKQIDKHDKKIVKEKQTEKNDKKETKIKETENNIKFDSAKPIEFNSKAANEKQNINNNKIGIQNQREKNGKLNNEKQTKNNAYVNSKKTPKSEKVIKIKETTEDKFPSIEDNTPQDHPSKIQDALTETSTNRDSEKHSTSKLASLISFTVKKKKPYGSILKEDNAAYQPLTVHSKNLDLIISPIRCDNCERRLVEASNNHTIKHLPK